MQVNIPIDLEPFVEEEFATGRYGRLRDERQQALAGIRQGLDDVAAGRAEPLADAFAEIRRGFGTLDPK